jgi:hypothetical protein
VTSGGRLVAVEDVAGIDANKPKRLHCDPACLLLQLVFYKFNRGIAYILETLNGSGADFKVRSDDHGQRRRHHLAYSSLILAGFFFAILDTDAMLISFPCGSA